jgi:hypothetical protein
MDFVTDHLTRHQQWEAVEIHLGTASLAGRRTVNCETASRPVEVANPWGR